VEEEQSQDNQTRRSPLRTLITLFVVVAIPLALGVYLASRLVPEPKVGIVRLNYDIFSITAYEIGEQLNYARQDPSVEAVVLIINSPGGSAAYSEEIYMDVLNTREEIPVVASIDLLAASGAYYMAAAADEIYAKPTSSIGSIGVFGLLPGPVFIEDEVLTTGPYKAFGGTTDGMVRQLEMAKLSFLKAIELGRGDQLKVDPAFLSRAEIFNGIQAEEMGLIDGLAATDGAIERAAELAGLRSYDVVELLPLTFPEFFDDAGYSDYRPESVDPQILWAPPVDLPTGLYYRYLEPVSNR
jgi:protease-4